MTEYARFTSAHELLDLLARRKADLGLSNETFDRVCGFTPGYGDKLIGPSRLKSPSMASLEVMLTALGLSGSLHVDEAKVRQVGRLWAREGRRKEASVRPASRISKAVALRAAPVWASMMAHTRWSKTTVEQRDAHCAMMRGAKKKRLYGKGR
jgi:hypothetical protein